MYYYFSSSSNPLLIFPLSVALFLLLLCTTTSAAAKSVPECSNQFLEMINSTNRHGLKCRKLTTLKAEFGWSFHRNMTSTIDVSFGARLDNDEGWLAWGVNPGKSPQMIGTRAVIGLKYQNGSFGVDTYNITSHTKLGCQLLPSKLDDDDDVSFRNLRIVNQTDFVVISATVRLISDQYNISELHHVWQVGDEVDENEPKKHPTNLQNVDSTETINLMAGYGRSVGQHRRHLRMVHGILNIVGWGTLLPLGVIVARYFRQFPFQWKYWFPSHVNIQIVGYTLGTIGWAIGLVLGNSSKYYTFRVHRILAIFIFTFTTLQMLALRLKPEASDEYRKYWDMYHHFLGYALLAGISVNIFQGIAILKPDQTWKWAYIGVLGALASITLFFEFCTWFKFLKQRKNEKDREYATRSVGGPPSGGGGPPSGGGGPPSGGGGPPGGGGGPPGGGGGPPGGVGGPPMGGGGPPLGGGPPPPDGKAEISDPVFAGGGDPGGPPPPDGKAEISDPVFAGGGDQLGK